MILIITHKEDFTADFVINKLNDRKIDYYRLNCEDIDKNVYEFNNRSGIEFRINRVNNFKSVWFRRTKLPEIKGLNEAEQLYLLGEYDALFDNLYFTLKEKKWLSHPSFVYTAENKLFQIKIASEIGFKIPDTIVTNEHGVLKKFILAHDNKIIIKPLRQGRIKGSDGMKTIYTNTLPTEFIQNLNTYSLTPSIFQELIEKDYEIRVTVVNGKVFSAKVNSQQHEETKLDWRKKKIPFEKYSLPDEMNDKCLLLLSKLGLSFGAIDLIKRKNGDYIFLEINPNGQWAWLEMEIGLQISDEIIHFLTTEQ